MGRCRAELAWLLATAALGLVLETQRRSMGAAVAVAARLGAPLGLLARPASVQDLVVGTAVVYDWAYHPSP